jgi:hypothetical protein
MAERPQSTNTPALERLLALDPADPGTPDALLDVVSSVDVDRLSPEEAAAITREVERITRAVSKALRK